MGILQERDIVRFPPYHYTSPLTQSELKQVAGSLTLGGYDAARFVPHNTTFSFAGDIQRDLVVGLKDIAITGTNGSTSFVNNSLLPDPILSFIDAGVPQIWLPRNACDLFAETFGLQYDPITSLYLINETMHEIMQRQNITLTFKISDLSSDGTNIVDIHFPYTAFDLTLTSDYPDINATTRYFPIRRAANDTQYTLGRTFLQQAYIVADYERSTFSVYPCVFSEGLKQDLRGIPPLSSNFTNNTESAEKPSRPEHSLVPGIIVAIAAGSIVAVFFISLGAFMLGRRRDSLHWYMLRIKALIPRRLDWRQPYGPKAPKAKNELPKDQAEMEGDVSHRAELTGDIQIPAELIADLQRPEELSAAVRHVPELESSATARSELPEGVIRYELGTGTDFSYVQTPLSKLAGPDEG